MFAKKKLLPSVDADGVRRFQREVRLLARLDHPNIVKVTGFHLQTPPYWYVMPRYHHTLYREIPALGGDQSRIVPIFTAILAGIEYAHAEGVIHRDLKPENVLMNSDDDLVITDSGLGRALDSESTRHTITGFGMGTFLYMAPEQMTNAKNADQRSDTYSLGRMLFEMFTGRLQSPLTDTSSLEAGIAHLIDKCTHADPQRRYQSVAELKHDFLSVMGVAPALSPYEEIATLIKALISTSSPQRSVVEHLLDLMGQHRSDTDLIHEALMQLPAKVATLMLAVDRKAARSLIEAFVTHITSQGWGFSYTDDIGSQCQRLYNAMSDPAIRANLIYCVMEVGAGHNRWYVMGIFDSLMAESRDVAESLAIAEVFRKAPSHLREWARERLKTGKLHPAITSALSEVEDKEE